MWPYAIEIADIDGDGRRDLAVAEFSGARGLEVLTNTTQAGESVPSFASPRSFPVPTNQSPYDVVVADFNTDGKPDIALAAATVWVGLNTSQPGIPSFTTLVSTGVVGFAITAGDLNGDQKPDLVAAKAGAADVVELLRSQPHCRLRKSDPAASAAATITIDRDHERHGFIDHRWTPGR